LGRVVRDGPRPSATQPLLGEQLALDLFAAEIEEEISVDELFRPNGRRRCPHCRKRLHPIGTTGRLVCASPYCTAS